MRVGPEQRSEPAKDETATPPRPGRTEEAAVESRRPESRLQSDVGNGAVAEHPVTQVAPAGEKMPAAAVSGKACAVSAATMPAASMFATMPAASVFATMPAASVFATMPAASVFATMPAAAVSATVPAAAVSATVPAAAVSAAAGVCFECEKRHYEEQRSGHASAGGQHRPHSVAGLRAPHRRSRPSLSITPRTQSF
jgi:hypothetical protein